MKALFLEAYGGPEKLSLREGPDPVPRRGEALVRVRFCSINPLDYKVRSGKLSPVSGLSFPRPLGSDFSGTVVASGPGTVGWEVGAEVYGHAAIMFGRPGALAELVAVPVKNLRLRPPHLPADAAACMPVAGTTALAGLISCGELKGRSVVVAGASGGVGHLVVQLARAREAVVTGIAGEANGDFVRGLGANVFQDYRTLRPGDLSEVNVYFDAFGSTPYGQARATLARGGVFVTTLPNPGLVFRKLFGGRIHFANRKTLPALYQELEDRVQSGQLRVHMGRTFALSEAAEALAVLERGGTPGKIVVRVSD